jgi:hypothetical protein
MKRIIDEFNLLPVSRQRRQQLRYVRDGLCRICGQPLVTKGYCLKHAVSLREYQRKRNGTVKQNQSLTRRLEKRTEDLI